MGTNRYACRVYKHRLDKVICEIDGVKFRCKMRKDSPWDYPGCPYNQGLEVIS
jgi:hypothetical protein